MRGEFLGVAALLAAGLLAAISQPALAADKRKEPEGFGKAKFGMRLSRVQSLYPKLRVIAVPTPVAGQEEPPLTLHMYRLEHQTFGPLKDCQIDMRFVAGKGIADPELYELQFLCPNKDKVLEYLQDEYGGPTTATKQGLLWTGEKVDITEVPSNGAFMFGDKLKSTQVQLTLLHYIMTHNVPATPVEETTPPAESPH